MVVGIAVKKVLDGASSALWVGIVNSRASNPRVVCLDMLFTDGVMETKESAGQDRDQILPEKHMHP